MLESIVIDMKLCIIIGISLFFIGLVIPFIFTKRHVNKIQPGEILTVKDVEQRR